MKSVYLVVALGLAIASNAQPARSQIAVPTIAGIPVHCTDPTGATVFTVFNPALGDLGQSSIAPNGMRIIALNPLMLGHLPPLFQLLTYAHECGHHLSGDILNIVLFRHDNIDREKNADRIGIRLLRDQLHITKTQAQQLSAFFVNNPPMWPYYLPGPARAKWIVDCYSTNNDSCTVGEGDEVSSTRERGGSFCSALHSVMADSESGFAYFRGARTPLAGDPNNWDSNRPLPGFTDCSVFGTGSDAEYTCSSDRLDEQSEADAAFRRYQSMVSACLGADWHGSRHTSKSGNRLIRYEHNGAATYVSVERRTSRRGNTTIDVDVDVAP